MTRNKDAIASTAFHLIWCSNQDWKDREGEVWIGRADGITWLIIVKAGPDDFRLIWHSWSVEVAHGESFRECALLAEEYMIERQIGLAAPKRLFYLDRLATAIHKKEPVPIYRCLGCAMKDKLGCDAQMMEVEDEANYAA